MNNLVYDAVASAVNDRQKKRNQFDSLYGDFATIPTAEATAQGTNANWGGADTLGVQANQVNQQQTQTVQPTQDKSTYLPTEPATTIPSVETQTAFAPELPGSYQAGANTGETWGGGYVPPLGASTDNLGGLPGPGVLEPTIETAGIIPTANVGDVGGDYGQTRGYKYKIPGVPDSVMKQAIAAAESEEFGEADKVKILGLPDSAIEAAKSDLFKDPFKTMYESDELGEPITFETNISPNVREELEGTQDPRSRFANYLEQYLSDAFGEGADFGSTRELMEEERDAALRQLAEMYAGRGMAQSGALGAEAANIVRASIRDMAQAHQQFRQQAIQNKAQAASMIFQDDWKKMDQEHQKAMAELLFELDRRRKYGDDYQSNIGDYETELIRDLLTRNDLSSFSQRMLESLAREWYGDELVDQWMQEEDQKDEKGPLYTGYDAAQGGVATVYNTAMGTTTGRRL